VTIGYEAHVTFGQRLGRQRPLRADRRRDQRVPTGGTPVVFDCVKLVLIRERSTILTTENDTTFASEGDLVFLRTATLCRGMPERTVTISTLYIDTDYLFELWVWQRAPINPSPLGAQPTGSEACA
jgi:AraC family transcriptional regulator